MDRIITPLQRGSVLKQSLRQDLLLTVLFAALAAMLAQLKINIPHTKVHLDTQWVFVYIAAVLVRRFWLALIVILAACGSGPSEVPRWVALFGNLSYALPGAVLVRLCYDYLLRRISNLLVFTAGWVILIVLVYELFHMPLVWAVIAILEERAILPAVLESWQLQPFLEEGCFVGLISAMAMAVIRAYQDLRQSQHRLAMTLNAMGEGMILTDIQGRVVNMNPAAENLTGWTLEEGRNEPLAKLYRIIDAASDKPNQNLLSPGGQQNDYRPATNETILVSRDGQRRQILQSIEPVRTAAGEGIGMVVVFRDVSQKLQAERALRVSEHRFRSFVENANDIVYSLSPEGVFTYVSPNWQEKLGEPPGTPLGRYFGEYVHPEEAPLCEAFLEEIVTHGQSRRGVEYRVRHADGHFVWHNSNGAPLRDERGEVISYVGIARDVTEQKQADQALTRSEGFLRQVGRLARVGGWEFDPATNVVTWHETTMDIFEHPEPKPSLDEAVSFFLEAGRDRVAEHVSRAIETGQPYEFEEEILTGKGNRRWVRSVGVPEMQEGTCVRLYGVVQDITDHHEMELQLRQSQKIEAIGQLAGSVAHDFNNLLTPILGYAELLEDHMDQPEVLAEGTQEIRQAASRARELVSQLLAFGRKQILQTRVVSLGEIIHANENMLRRLIREDISLQLDFSDADDCACVDPSQIVQVLMNLIVNAIAAMPEGGRLHIATSRRELTPADLNSNSDTEPGTYAVLSVRDSGVGMSQDVREQVFEPFFTTKQEHQGTGLGLATVYGIIRQHGGCVEVHSTPGQGSCFEIFLPAADRAEKQDEPSSQTRSTGRETLLLVEDDLSVLAFVESALKRLGYDVLSTSSPVAALEIVRDKGEAIDLMITDVIMPKMTGAALADEVERIRPDLKVIFVSGYTHDVIAPHGVLEDGIHFLQKPFSPSELGQKIRQVLDGE
jgi:two-component system, cell cycle sensor histidine kinase and response regulator CckA